MSSPSTHTRPAPGALPPLAHDAFDVGATSDSLARLVAAAATGGDIFRIHMPGRAADAWILNNPDDIRRVLLTNHDRYAKGIGLTDRVAILLGNGIIVSHGELWKRQRRMIQPAFTRRAHATFAEVICQRIDVELQDWRRRARASETIDLTGALGRMALDIVLRALFSDDLEWLHERGGEAMPERQLIDAVMTMIIAGHETSATAMNFTWYLVSRNPQAEQRLHAEIDALPDQSLWSFEDPRERYVYIPFGAGPRRCIGEEFSLYEMSVHFARIARHLRLVPADDTPMELDAAINLRTRQPLRMRLIARHG